MLSVEKMTFSQRAIHLFALCSFALAQPLYHLLAGAPEFFTAHHTERPDLILMIGVLSLGIPALLILLTALARVFGRRVQEVVYCVLIVTLFTLCFLPLVNDLFNQSAWLALTSAGCLAVLFCVLLLKFRLVQSILSVLVVTVLLFPAIFVLSPSVNAQLFPERNALVLDQVDATAPVVMLVLDELPLSSLLDQARNIDNQRYPNFARLANRAWWFRNATTVSDDTVAGAIPAIMTGTYPSSSKHRGEVERSVFTLLGGSYDMHVYETYTRVCPLKLCPRHELSGTRLTLLFQDLAVVYAHIVVPEGMRGQLPDITQGWRNFANQHLTPSEQRSRRLNKLWNSRVGWFNTFVDAIHSRDDPGFYFLHVLLPHLPWQYLPNGNEYTLQAKGLYGVPGVKGEWWGIHHWPVKQGYQRHLLQLGYVDTLLGDLINRLEKQGIFDDALIVVTSDHGVSFRTQDSRRPITEKNMADILRVPLFVKAPGQREGKISDRVVETVDILPTIADLLHIDLPWKVDGLSALDTSAQPKAHRTVHLQSRRSRAQVRHIPESELREYEDLLHTKLRWFGEGGSNDRLYRMGPNNALIGQPTTALPMARHSGVTPTVSLDTRKAANGAPWALTGSLVSVEKSLQYRPLAVAVDGEICAVTRSYANSQVEEVFVAFIGEDCASDSKSVIEVYDTSDMSSRGAVRLY
ncbi:MAG: sulfatase-like hydrolase/transferase [Gammaproteobacteria bacterium]|nr:sulfatase-like hydrolase/transferase [Gammaproteobacteria bacterium]